MIKIIEDSTLAYHALLGFLDSSTRPDDVIPFYASTCVIPGGTGIIKSILHLQGALGSNCLPFCTLL